MQPLLFHNVRVVPMTAQADEPQSWVGSVAVAEGRIAALLTSDEMAEEYLRRHPDCRVVDGRGKLLMPGLINTHCHAGMTLQRNSADDIPLMAWLHDRIWPFEQRQTADDVALATRLGVAELLLGGVTSVVEMYFESDLTVEVFDEMGMRALVGTNCFEATIDAAFETVLKARERCADSPLVQVAIAPHAPYTVSPEGLERCRKFAEEQGLPLMIHLAETEDELRQVEEQYGMRPVALLDKVGLLTPRTIAAHCVHLTDEEITLLAERGVVVAHCAQCNMKISSGTAPVARMLQAGVTVTLATDGPASNNDLDLWEELRAAAFQQKLSTRNPLSLPAYEVLRMATVEGARAMGLAGELGIIKEGALADVILLDLQKPHLQPLGDVVSTLVYSAKASDVEMVVVGGRVVVENRRVVGLDTTALLEEANRRAEALRGVE